MSIYKVPFSRFALKWASIFFFMSLAGGLLAFPLVGAGAILLNLMIGMALFFFAILISLYTTPYRLDTNEDGIKLHFRLRPTKFIYYFELKGISLSPNEHVPVLRVKGSRAAFIIAQDSVDEILMKFKAEL